jgi:phenylalanine-4-hydroxylase
MFPRVLEANNEIHSDHIGFHDQEYRNRRKEIVKLTESFCLQKRNYPVIEYLPSENQTWKTVFEKLEQIYPDVVCSSYLENFKNLKKDGILNSNEIPKLENVSDYLEKKSGFRLYPVSGLLTPSQFLNGLASKIFYCTQYIRHPSDPFYTPEPDIIHEMLGHVPMFLDKNICEISEMIGKVSMICSENQIKHLERLYWFTIEFGILNSNKIYGAGILSSYGEIQKILKEKNKINIIPFEIKSILHDEPLITQMQQNYYTIESLEELKMKIEKYLQKTFDFPNW